MWAGDREQLILRLLSTVDGRMQTDRLAEVLKVSRETIRRDLLKLEAAGKVRRVHGGVIAVEESAEKPFLARRSLHAEAKQRIAQAAARLLKPGESCFIDAGTTTAAFAVALTNVALLSVVTNSLEIATTLRNAQPTAGVLLLGGNLATDVPGTHGELTIGQIARFRPALAFISTVGVHPEHGATNYLLSEAEVARAMIANAGRVVLLADRSKLGQVSRMHVCDCAEIDVLVTERGGHPLLASLKKAGISKVVEA
jgi:DeoR/GlpR family transcriptional regulator of sugar metabolism